MTWFEILSAWSEAKAAYVSLVLRKFDSSYSWWKYRKSKFAEIKARYYMTKQIADKEAEKDDLSRVIS